MNTELIRLLKAHRGDLLTWELAAEIYCTATRVQGLVSLEQIGKIESEQHEAYTFARERMEDIIDEMRPLHAAHWAETEGHRHGMKLHPDYDAFIRYERAGRFILFTVRQHGILVGNCAMYLTQSAHTQTLMAKEDTLYFLPVARQGRTANRFIAYCEKALTQLGVREINVSVKLVNKAGRFFQILGYRHVENGLTKVLED